MALSLNAQALQYRQPHVAERCVFWQSKVLPQFQVGPASGKKGWAIIKIVNAADIRSESQ